MSDNDSIPPCGGLPGPPPGAAPVFLPERRGRRGKISRLPASVRNELNVRLQDGRPAGEICAWLNSLEAVRAIVEKDFHGEPVNDDNVWRWRSSGYLAWEEEQRTMEAVSLFLEGSAQVQEAAREGLSNRIAAVLSAKLAVQLWRYESLEEGEEKSALFERLLRAAVLLRRGDLHFERLRAERERHDLRRYRSREELEAAFMRWLEEPENAAKVLAKLTAGGAGGRKAQRQAAAERVRRIKAAIGIR